MNGVLKNSEDTCSVGITHHAQDSLGDRTFVELPSVGQKFQKNDVFGVVESVKAKDPTYTCLLPVRLLRSMNP